MEVRSPQNEQEWKEYYDLRFRVLREPLGKPRGSEQNEGDASGIHLALYDEDNLCAITRLDQASSGVSQVRFVAVDPQFRGKGYGRIIMQEAEVLSKASGNTKMILQARDYSVAFYLALDYKVVEKSHKLFGVLQHFLMEKSYS